MKTEKELQEWLQGQIDYAVRESADIAWAKFYEGVINAHGMTLKFLREKKE